MSLDVSAPLTSGGDGGWKSEGGVSYVDYASNDSVEYYYSDYVPPTTVVGNVTYCYDAEQGAYTWCINEEYLYAVPIGKKIFH